MKRAVHLGQKHRRFGALLTWRGTPQSKQAAQSQPMSNERKIEPIGVIETPFREPAGTPIQPSRANGARGKVRVEPRFWGGLRDLAGLERIWLIYWLHRRPDSALLARWTL